MRIEEDGDAYSSGAAPDPQPDGRPSAESFPTPTAAAGSAGPAAGTERTAKGDGVVHLITGTFAATAGAYVLTRSVLVTAIAAIMVVLLVLLPECRR